MNFRVVIDDHSGEESYVFETEGANFAEALDHPDVMNELEGRDEGRVTVDIRSLV